MRGGSQPETGVRKLSEVMEMCSVDRTTYKFVKTRHTPYDHDSCALPHAIDPVIEQSCDNNDSLDPADFARPPF